VFNPGILMQGGVLQILSDSVVAAALVVTAALVLHGYVRHRPIQLALRGVFALAALAMAVPRPEIQYAAVAVAVIVYLLLWRGEARLVKAPAE
jgi:TRAP-type uncharacterized transport system fused permease subunit